MVTFCVMYSFHFSRVKGGLLSADTTTDTRAVGLRFRLMKQLRALATAV